MKIKSSTLQRVALAVFGVGFFLALGTAGTFDATGELMTGAYTAAFVLILLAALLVRLSFALQDWEEKQRKIHKTQRGTVKPTTKRKAG